MASPGVTVFAVEDTSIQVCWHDLGPGEVTFEAAGTAATVVSRRGPGATTLDRLPPATELDLTLTADGRPRRRVATVKTLAPPPGRLLTRFATVNDLHVGERRFGLLMKLQDPDSHEGEPYPLRCARAALAEAQAWGASAIVAKGDLTYRGTAVEWDPLARLLGEVAVPVHIILGNHDVGSRAVDGREILARHTLTVTREPATVDFTGIRLVLVPTAIPRHQGGRIDAAHQQAVVELLAAAPGPAFVAMHHYPQPLRLPTTYPPGIPGPMARRFLDAIAGANPATFVSTGHSHRHRLHRHGPLVLTEIGATMHYPGTWAGYAVHEGGIRQVVRRVAAPDAIAWTERGRRVVGGIWGWYSPGPRRSRCFTHPWPPLKR